MAAQEMLREYLISLGFKVDLQQAKKFDNTILDIGKKAGGAGLAVAGLAATVAGMAQVYANAMEKLYYTARHTNSTVASLSALSSAGERVGISSERMQAAVQGVSAAMRNAGKLDFMGKLLHRNVREDEDPAKLLVELGKAINALPLGQANKATLANTVGIDSEMLVDLRNNVDELDEGIARYQARLKALGIDLDAIGKSSHEWNNALRDLKTSVGSLGDVLGMKLIGPMHAFKQITDDTLDNVIKKVSESHGAFGAMWELVKGTAGPLLSGDLSTKALGYSGTGDFLGNAGTSVKDWLLSFSNGGKGGASTGHDARVTPPPSASTDAQKQQRLAELDAAYSFPEGTLDSLWRVESARGSNMGPESKAHYGQFQMGREERKRWGVNNPASFDEEAPAAAAMLDDLVQRYGSLPRALAAWNGGSAAAHDISRAVNPTETAAFVPNVMRGIQQHQTNNFTINSDNPHVVRAAVVDGLATANGNLVRDQVGAVR